MIALRCTLGLGSTQPGKWKDAGRALNNPALEGCYMPDGPGVRSHGQQYLQYNEVRIPFVPVSDVNQVGYAMQYIVYDTSQIRLRYLLMVKMG